MGITLNPLTGLFDFTGSSGSGASIGGPVTGGTDKAVLFVHPNNILAQDETNFNYDPATHNLTITGNISAVNVSGSNTGDVTLTAVGSSPNADGASLSGQALTLQPADATHPGLLSILAQTIAGDKTFNGNILSGNANVNNIGSSGSPFAATFQDTANVTTVVGLNNGSLDLRSADITSGSANSADVTLETGNSHTGNTGTLTIQTGGPDISGSTGSIIIQTGPLAGAGTRGNVDVNGNILNLSSDGGFNITGGTGLDLNATSGFIDLNSSTKFTGLTASRPLKLDASKIVVSTQIDLSSTNDITGTLAIGHGGTNSATALNNNRVMISSGGAIVEQSAITANRALASDSNGLPVASTTTDTELGYLSGVTSSVQTQLNGKANTALSNLTTTSINQNLIPASSLDLGASGNQWRQLYVSQLISFASDKMDLETSITSPSSVSGTYWHSATSGVIGMFTNSASTSSNLNIETGNASGGNSGAIVLQSGTATGTRGKISLNGSSVDVNSTNIINVTDPSNPQDAATKNYVDTHTNTVTGDISQTSFTAADNQVAAANVTGLAFANASVRSFDCTLSIARGSTYAAYKLYGIQKGSSWEMNQQYAGDDTGIVFTITTAGQVQYTSTSTGSTGTVKFRAFVTSV